MATSHRLRLHDVRRVHDLVDRIAEVGDRPSVWRRVALEGLATLLGGNVGLTTDLRTRADGMPIAIDPIDVGWHTEGVRQRFGTYVASGEMAADPGTRALLAAQRARPVVAATRRELVGDADWYGSPCVSEARHMGDVDDFVVCSVALAPGVTHGLIVYRPWRDPPFEARHRRVLRLFQVELARAARRAAALEPVLGAMPRLGPRLRQTLELMLTPLSLKEIAARLRLSRHTINDYQKALYRTFNVGTRPELMAAFRPMRRPICLPDGLFN